MQLSEKEEELEGAQAMIGGIRDEAERANRELSLQIADLLSQLEKNEATLLTLSDEKSDMEMALARQRQDFSSLEWSGRPAARWASRWLRFSSGGTTGSSNT